MEEEAEGKGSAAFFPSTPPPRLACHGLDEESKQQQQGRQQQQLHVQEGGHVSDILSESENEEREEVKQQHHEQEQDQQTLQPTSCWCDNMPLPLPHVIRTGTEAMAGSYCEGHEPGQCCHSIFLGLAAATVAWFCWGLSFFVAPLGPTGQVPSADQVRTSYRRAPVAFFLLQLGRFLGGILFGHVGDRNGRRHAFAAALVLTGLSTIALGSLPIISSLTPTSTGNHELVQVWWGVLRFCQGLGIGGQWPGTILIPLEFCQSDQNAAISAAMGHSGMPLGLALSAGAAYLLSVAKPSTSFPLRSAFWTGGILLFPLALWVISGDKESETFEDIKTVGDIEKVPLVATIKGRGRALIFGWLTLLIDALPQAMLIYQWAFLLPKGIHNDGSPQAGGKFVDGSLSIGLFFMALCTLLGAYLRDRMFTRCTLYGVGASITCVGVWVWCSLAGQTAHEEKPLFALMGAYILVLGPGLGLMQGSLASLLPEPFPTSIAYTGSALIYNTVHAAVNAAYPALAMWLLHGGGGRLFDLGGNIDPVLLAVVTVVFTFLSYWTSHYLRGYEQRPSLRRLRGLLVRDCIALATTPPPTLVVRTSSPPTIVVRDQ